MAFYEEWEDDDPDICLGICERCGQEKLVKPVVDPFVLEKIIEDEEPVARPWCGACTDERWGDV